MRLNNPSLGRFARQLPSPVLGINYEDVADSMIAITGSLE